MVFVCCAANVIGADQKAAVKRTMIREVTGANVPEDQVKVIVHVNNRHPQASDKNPGTKDLPFATISKGARIAELNDYKGIGTKVLVYPGLYREAVDLKYRGKPSSDAPMVFEATEKNKVIVSGSDVWTGWKQQDQTSIYTHRWPYKWGLWKNIWKKWIVLQPITQRRELIFVNGKMLTPVLSVQELKEGTFTVSEEKEIAYICPPAGTDMAKAIVEVCVRSFLFRSVAKKNIVLRGFTFTHSAGVMFSVAAYVGGNNVLIEDCTTNWNNSGGLGFGYSNVTVRRCTSKNNGGSGMAAHRISNIIVEDCETSFNNWRGNMGGLHGWSVGGVKFLRIYNGIFRRNRSIGNHAHGYWFDSDNVNILLEDCLFAHNDADGIFLEANPGPITLRRTVMAHNKTYGLISTNSSNVTLEDNIFYGNRQHQIYTTGATERKVRDTWDKSKFKMIKIENWTLRGNVFVATSPTQRLVNVVAWDHFLGTLKSDRNIWYKPMSGKSFELSGMQLNLAEWQDATGQDSHSISADPKFENPDADDFSLMADSPLKSKASWKLRSSEERVKLSLKDMKRRQIDDNWSEPYPVAAKAGEEDFHRLDLLTLANRPLSGKGGWIGAGLKCFPPGDKLIHGVPFSVIDEENNGKRGVIALRSSNPGMQKSLGKLNPTEVAVPVGMKAKAIYFLHGCAWATKHQKVGDYTFVYEDGSRAVVDLIPYGLNSEHLAVNQQRQKDSTIQDWFWGFPQFENNNARKVIVADRKDPLGYMRYIYTLQWINPHPEKTIKEIRLRSDPALPTGIMVIAVTVLKTP